MSKLNVLYRNFDISWTADSAVLENTSLYDCVNTSQIMMTTEVSEMGFMLHFVYSYIFKANKDFDGTQTRFYIF